MTANPAVSERVGCVPLTQRDLESRLWDGADGLRGPVGPGDFKTCIVRLLSFERISDALG